MLNIGQHFTPHTAMTLIYDKHQAFLADSLNGFCTYLRIILDVRHLLDRGHDQLLVLILALQFIHQYQGVLSVLNSVILTSKTTIFVKRLYAQFDTIQKEYHLIRIARIGNQLGCLKARHGLT